MAMIHDSGLVKIARYRAPTAINRNGWRNSRATSRSRDAMERGCSVFAGYLGEIRLINLTPRDERVREVHECADCATKYRLLKSWRIGYRNLWKSDRIAFLHTTRRYPSPHPWLRFDSFRQPFSLPSIPLNRDRGEGKGECALFYPDQLCDRCLLTKRVLSHTESE